MNCEIIRDLLPLYAEQMTSEATAQAVREHLETCPACRAELERISTPAPAAEEQILPLQKLQKTLRRRRGLAVLLAVCLTAAALSVLFFHVSKPVYYSAEGYEQLPSGEISVPLPSQATGWQVEYVSEPESTERFAVVLTWSTVLDRWIGKQNPGEIRLPDDITAIFSLVPEQRTPVLITDFGHPVNGGFEILPRLALGAYLLMAAVGAAVLAAAGLLLRRRKAGRVLLRAACLPAAWVAAQLLLKGTDTISWTLSRDFLWVLGTCLLLFGAAQAAVSLRSGKGV